MCVHTSGRPAKDRAIVREAVLSARVLRKFSQPLYPMALIATEDAHAMLSASEAALWEVHRTLRLSGPILAMRAAARGLERKWSRQWERPARLSFVHKLQALLDTPFARTVFVDCDLYVLDGTPKSPAAPCTHTLHAHCTHTLHAHCTHTLHAHCTHTLHAHCMCIAGAFVDRLLTQTLRLADLAMPIDPWRGRLWAAAPQPPLCSALTAYRSDAPGMRELIVEAAGRLVNGSERHLHPDVNPGDQTALWFAYVLTAPRTRLRVLALPEEPLRVRSSRSEASAHSPSSTLCRRQSKLSSASLCQPRLIGRYVLAGRPTPLF